MPFIQYGTKINSCNNSFDETNHGPSCMGNCERLLLSDIDVDIHNETILWHQNDMAIQGIPILKPPFPGRGIGIDLFQLEVQLQGLIRTLSEEQLEAFQEKSKEVLLEKLRNTRTIFEAMKERDAEAKGIDILLPHKRLYIPNGDDEIKH